METLIYALGFIIGALGTWFLLYFLKTRKTMRQQHKIIMDLTFALIGKDIAKKREKTGKADKETAAHVAAREEEKCCKSCEPQQEDDTASEPEAAE